MAGEKRVGISEVEGGEYILIGWESRSPRAASSRASSERGNHARNVGWSQCGHMAGLLLAFGEGEDVRRRGRAEAEADAEAEESPCSSTSLPPHARKTSSRSQQRLRALWAEGEQFTTCLHCKLPTSLQPTHFSAAPNLAALPFSVLPPGTVGLIPASEGLGATALIGHLPVLATWVTISLAWSVARLSKLVETSARPKYGGDVTRGSVPKRSTVSEPERGTEAPTHWSLCSAVLDPASSNMNQPYIVYACTW